MRLIILDIWLLTTGAFLAVCGMAIDGKLPLRSVNPFTDAWIVAAFAAIVALAMG